MKDEEIPEEEIKKLAEEYIDNCTKRAGFVILAENIKSDFIDLFVAGFMKCLELKAGRPQWHDLRKDPNDLPKEPSEKMKVNETWVYVKFFDNTYGLVDKGALNNYSGAIAWCELPTFDKE